MAATWTTNFEALDVATRSVRATGTRTDGADVRTYTAEGTVDPADRAASLARVINALWDAFQADQAQRTARAALIAGAETAVSNALNAKELL